MQSLTHLLNSRDPRDPLVGTLRALLDAGLVVATRDGGGRFVQMSEVYGEALGLDVDVRGSDFVSGQRFYDPTGREIPRSEHPAQVARMSGIPQRNRVLGVRSPSGLEVWMQASFLPLEQEAGGWSVLTVGVILERGPFSAPSLGQDAGSEVILAFAEAVAGRRLSPAELATHLAPVVEAILPAQLSTSLFWRRGEFIEIAPIRRTLSHPPTPFRFIGETARRWHMTGTFYSGHVRDTDSVGDRLAIEYDPPVRSLAVVPVPNIDGNRIASIAVTSPVQDALTPEHIGALERLGRLAGAALALAPSTAAA